MKYCSICGVGGGCNCLFSEKDGKLICGLCSGKAKKEKVAEIRRLQEEQGLVRRINLSDSRGLAAPYRKNVNIYTWQDESISFANVLQGRVAFLLCSGPSLASLDLSLLNQRGVVTMGMNNSPALFKPNYWVAGDTPGKFIEQIWLDPTITKFIPYGKKDKTIRYRDSAQKLYDSHVATWQMPNTYYFMREEEFNPATYFSSPAFQWGTLSSAKDKVGVEGKRTTMLLAIKMLWYLGAKTIYLLGCDFNMKEGRDNYAFKQGRDKGSVKSNNAIYKGMNKRFEALKPQLRRMGLKIYNCTTGSGLRAFDYVKYESAVEIATQGISNRIITEKMYETIK